VFVLAQHAIAELVKFVIRFRIEPLGGFVCVTGNSALIQKSVTIEQSAHRFEGKTTQLYRTSTRLSS
jgi:hypothetical protein